MSETDLDAEMAYKADLVGGVVPDAQLPAHVKVNNWTVAVEADLVTLTTATVNDRAFVGAAAPYETYYLLALPQFPAVQAALDDKAPAADLPLLAPLASPALTGTPTAPTTPAGTATTQLASTKFVTDAIDGITIGAAFAMVPDYAAQETVNRIAANNGTWTAGRGGFVYCHVDANALAAVSIFITKKHTVAPILSQP